MSAPRDLCATSQETEPARPIDASARRKMRGPDAPPPYRAARHDASQAPRKTAGLHRRSPRSRSSRRARTQQRPFRLCSSPFLFRCLFRVLARPASEPSEAAPQRPEKRGGLVNGLGQTLHCTPNKVRGAGGNSAISSWPPKSSDAFEPPSWLAPERTIGRPLPKGLMASSLQKARRRTTTGRARETPQRE